MADGRVRTNFTTMDGLRGAAAICVMLHHYTHGSLNWFPSGFVGVDIFFVLSGWVIAHAYQAKLEAGLGALGFARIRLIRLYPMYLLGLGLGLVGYLVNGHLLSLPYSASALVSAALSGALMLPNLAPLPMFDGQVLSYTRIFPFDYPAWSLFFELVANVAFYFYRPRGLARLTTLGVLFAAYLVTTLASGVACGPMQSILLGGFPRALVSFYAGASLYELARAGYFRRMPSLPLAPIALAAFVCAMAPSMATYIFVVAIGAPLIVILSVAEPRSPALRSAFRTLGVASYPIYVLHIPVLILATAGWNTIVGVAPTTLLPPLVSLGLAAVLVVVAIWLADRVDAPVRAWLTRVLASPLGRGGSASKSAAVVSAE